MNKHEKHLRDLLQSADMETVERIAEQFPAAEDAAKERIYHKILTAQQLHNPADSIQADEVPVICHNRYRGIWAAAACLLICGGIIGTAALHRPETLTEDARTASRIDRFDTTLEAEETIYTAPETNAPAQRETTASLEIQPETTAAVAAETTIVTVIAYEPVRTEEILPVQETQAAETAALETVTAMIQDTAPAQTTTISIETVSIESTVQNKFEFISMAENIPVVPGFKVILSESESGPTCAIWPENAADGKSKIEMIYRPAYLPAGWTLDTEQLAVMEQNYTEMEETYIYEHWYHPPKNADGSYPLTDTYLLLTQKRLNADGVELPLVKDESACYLMREQKYVYGVSGLTEPDDLYTYSYTATEINAHPAYIYRDHWADNTNADNLHYTQYTLYWEQDGYLFSLYTANVPESYLHELIRIAESVQPIG